jgi:hypothetical protein
VLARHGAWGVSVHSVWVGAVMLAVLGLAAEGTGAVAELTAADWAALAYLAIMVTAVAFLLWYSAVAALGSGRVGLLTGVAPVSAALTGVLTGSRPPGPVVWTGILVVIAGLAGGLGCGQRRAGPGPAVATGTPRPPPARSAEVVRQVDEGWSALVQVPTMHSVATGFGPRRIWRPCLEGLASGGPPVPPRSRTGLPAPPPVAR